MEIVLDTTYIVYVQLLHTTHCTQLWFLLNYNFKSYGDTFDANQLSNKLNAKNKKIKRTENNRAITADRSLHKAYYKMHVKALPLRIYILIYKNICIYMQN